MGNIVLVGAGGTGMSGVASILSDLGYTNIVCIDGTQSQLTDKLQQKGLKVIIGHGKYKVQLGDSIIYSEATAECQEILEARKIMKANKKVMIILNYFQFLGEISKYFTTIGFTGTNGKSSSTALAIYTAQKVLPTFGLGILGALVPSFNTQSYLINPKAKKDIKTIFDYLFSGKNFSSLENSSSSLIKKRHFFVEACEYKRHFLHLDLDYAVITSLELDHTDYYKDIHDYLSAFTQLITKVKQKVFLPKGLKSILKTNNFIDITNKLQEVTIKPIAFKYIRGKHNNINGSLVLGLLSQLTKKSHISEIKNFTGLRRRMELIGKNKHNATIFSDYGHMASSIELGYHALKKKFPQKKILVIFQPHQINRIITGRNDFIKAMKYYDTRIIYDIYAARENLGELVKKIPQLKNISSLKHLGETFAKTCKGTYIENFEDITTIIEQTKKNTIIVVYSAGDIDYKLRKYLGK